MIIKTAIPVLFICSIGIAVFSCNKDKAPVPVTPDVCTSLPATVSFKHDLIPLFKSQCSIAGCHSGGSPGGHLNLDSLVAYSQLMQAGKGYVDTVNIDASVLYAFMISSSQIMPPSGKLDNCSIQLVYKWIQQKAKNN